MTTTKSKLFSARILSTVALSCAVGSGPRAAVASHGDSDMVSAASPLPDQVLDVGLSICARQAGRASATPRTSPREPPTPTHEVFGTTGRKGRLHTRQRRQA